ncbi:MAG: TrmH family RNA methyltransferase [Lentisphaeria bacterium]|nr:TrmH family RNA methyltransferase [Lentisphaeria bacterium]
MEKNNNKLPALVLILDRLRSAHNTGNIFRIAEALGAGVVPCGYTPAPPHPKLEKTAMGTDKTVPWRHFETSAEAVDYFHAEGYTVLAAEPGGIEAWEMEFPSPLAVIFGNEALGVSADALEKVDGIVSLAMHGSKASINVGNAAAAITYAIDAKWQNKLKI